MMKQKKKQCGGRRGGVVLKKMKKTQTTTAASYHPPYFEMIKEALLALNNTNGSSPHAISKYMEERYISTLPCNFRKILGIQLKKSVEKGKLIKIKASYKLYSSPPLPEEEEEKKKKEEEMKKKERQRPELTALTNEEEVQELIRNLKPYVKVPWRKKNEPLTPKDVELGMSYGTKRPTEEEKKKDIKLNFDSKESMKVPNVNTKEFEEIYQKYYNQLYRSEGFEIDDFPPGSSLLPLIPVYDLEDEYLVNKAEKALSCFNDLNGTRFSFVKVKRANKHYPYGLQFFITFLAKMPGGRTDSLVTFQARAYEDQYDREDIKVRFCRIKGM